jgi:serine protease Do
MNEEHSSSIIIQPTAGASPLNAPKPKRRNGAILAIAFVAFLSLLTAGASLTISISDMLGDKAENKTSSGNFYDGNSVGFEDATIESVAEKVASSVVSITTMTKSNRSWYYSEDYYSSGAGTGMIVSADGYILTNKHVVSGATKFMVVMADGETYEDVEVVGEDPLNDVAFLKINGVNNLPTVTLGDSKTVAVGQPVLAIGNALGLYQSTITSGIISGKGRSLTASLNDGSGTETLTDMLQTDASINSGNSGGPLVNAAGQVIGINTAVSTDAQGIGFAIPIGAVKGMLKSLLATGKLERAVLGVRYLSITPDLAKEYSLPVKSGAYLHQDGSSAVISGSPAERAGLKTEDIILAVNDVEIGNSGGLSNLISEYAVGETISLKVLRGSETLTIGMRLEIFEF